MDYKVFNPDYLENVTGGDREIREEIVAIFRDQIPEFITEMKQLNEKKQFLELGLLAHKAKGSVTVMGMEETSKMLKAFELKAKAGLSPDDYPDFISRFEADTILVMKEIDHYIGKTR
ncbi:MAG TPA: Hpt domain-containing protein [Bacteroidales bacterium]|nr:Hpt domain-containing protein [Bacteroidales bacterium]